MNEKYGVSMAEAERVFFNEPLLLLEDTARSQKEPRLHALGKTHEGRGIHITFTLRQNEILIRIISARDKHRKKRAIYEQADESRP
ncbi:MAG: BrnT family toxin [Polaromonas sp.]|nr:BrnT family toxin [Polaromonas sp.]